MKKKFFLFAVVMMFSAVCSAEPAFAKKNRGAAAKRAYLAQMAQAQQGDQQQGVSRAQAVRGKHGRRAAAYQAAHGSQQSSFVTSVGEPSSNSVVYY